MQNSIPRKPWCCFERTWLRVLGNERLDSLILDAELDPKLDLYLFRCIGLKHMSGYVHPQNYHTDLMCSDARWGPKAKHPLIGKQTSRHLRNYQPQSVSDEAAPLVAYHL